MIVQLHSVVLLNIADTLTRLLANRVGVLLGHASDDRIVVVTSFEIAAEENIHTRFGLYKNVYPQSSIVGIYQLNGRDEQKLELVEGIGIPNPVLLTIDESFVPQSYINGSLVKTVIDSSETELIAASTIDSHKQLNSKSKEQVTVHDFEETLNASLVKLIKLSQTPIDDQDVVALANSLIYNGPQDIERVTTSTAAAQLAVLTSKLLGGK